MSLDLLLTQTVTRLRATATTDEYGNPVDGWDNPNELALKGRMQQKSGDEMTIDRDLQRSEWLLITRDDADITGRDRIRYDGEIYRVVGPPQVIQGFRESHHIEATLVHFDE